MGGGSEKRPKDVIHIAKEYSGLRCGGGYLIRGVMKFYRYGSLTLILAFSGCEGSAEGIRIPELDGGDVVSARVETLGYIVDVGERSKLSETASIIVEAIASKQEAGTTSDIAPKLYYPEVAIRLRMSSGSRFSLHYYVYARRVRGYSLDSGKTYQSNERVNKRIEEFLSSFGVWDKEPERK